MKKSVQTEKELHLLVLYGDNEHSFVEYTDTPSDLKRLEDKYTAIFSAYSLPKPNFKHWKQEAKKGKCYALLLRIEQIQDTVTMTQKALTKESYDTAIETMKDMRDNRMSKTIALRRNLPRDINDDSQT